ncbi:MAG: amidase family protein [Nanoarchaeota archaeon]
MKSMWSLPKIKTQEHITATQKGSVDLLEHTHKVLESVKRINAEYSYFNNIDDNLALKQAKQCNTKGRLAGVILSVKDCICVQGMESTAGSAILKGYRPVFDATAIQRAKQAGAIVIGKTSQDEFGFGSFNVNVGVGFRIPTNPHDHFRATGGSSGGSAGITSMASFPHLSLAESTGGSIANPAAFCGVVGLTPTYARVSRYGLIDYANSLDKIGTMARSVEEAALLLEIIQGYDSQDSTSSAQACLSYASCIGKSIKKFRIGLLKDSFRTAVHPKIQQQVERAKKVLEDAGAVVEEIDLPFTSKYGIPVYYILALSEASTNLAKFCGIRYGQGIELNGFFNEYFSSVRERYFGAEAKRRIILGTFARMAGYRDAFYIRSAQIRARIIEEYRLVFKKYQAILSPAMPILPPRFDEIKKLTPLQSYMMDILTVGPNLAGMPHISVPFGSEKGLPIGVMLTTNQFNESGLVQIASHLEVG